MASNFFTFSFEQSPGRTGGLAAQIPLPPSTPSTRSAVNSSLPALSRRAASGTVSAALAAGNDSASRPPRQPVAVAAAQDARLQARFHYMKRAITSRFRAWHRGMEAYGQWNEARAWYFTHMMRVPPRSGPFPGFNPPDRVRFPPLFKMALRGPPRPGLMSRLRARIRRQRNQSQQQGQDPRDVKAKQLEKPIQEDFQPAGFTFRKRLGIGGQGAVYLLDMVAEDGRKIPIVVKACVGRESGSDDALKEEKEAMMCLTGAHHAVQRVVLQGLPYPAPKKRVKNKLGAMLRIFGRRGQNAPIVSSVSAEDEMRADRLDLDNANDVIIVEYMTRGSVQGLIERMEKEGTRMSSRALWLILECLFKACIAMAYPLRFAEDGKDLFNARHRQQDEVVPIEAIYELPRGPIVHFDLDPQNALIGDFGAPGGPHEFVPSFKVSDMGLAEWMDQSTLDSEFDMWQFRLHGKPQIFAPEQFTEEWEYEASIDQAHLKREETAGNYQWWTNLFQVGWIMWSLITHAYPPVPPTIHWYEYPDPGAPDGYGGDGSGNDNVNYLPGMSYGGQILGDEYNDYDLCLRTLIVRLLDHNPTKRPKLTWMEMVLDQSVRRDDLVLKEPDEEFRKAMHRLFGGA